MATDGPDPPKCDDEIFANGAEALLTHGISSNRMEGWVKKVAEKSGQRVDWHFAGGYARVLALGDLVKVQEAIQELMPEHDRLREETTAALELRRNAQNPIRDVVSGGAEPGSGATFAFSADSQVPIADGGR